MMMMMFCNVIVDMEVYVAASVAVAAVLIAAAAQTPKRAARRSWVGCIGEQKGMRRAHPRDGGMVRANGRSSSGILLRRVLGIVFCVACVCGVSSTAATGAASASAGSSKQQPQEQKQEQGQGQGQGQQAMQERIKQFTNSKQFLAAFTAATAAATGHSSSSSSKQKTAKVKHPSKVGSGPGLCPAPGSSKVVLKNYAKEMFDFGYQGYLAHAFPLDELDPVHCVGRGVHPDAANINVNDVLGNYSLTLIDSLDTVAIMGNKTMFWDAVGMVLKHVSFDQNSTVQVFEVTIRVLGGLLSAHLLATDPTFQMTNPSYDDELLWLARDLANRLLPAFENAPFGIPHPRVNLRHGVPRNGRNDTCTAGAGTLLLEFGVLSRLAGDPIFESVARRAMFGLWNRRDPNTGLLGSTINMQTGQWIDTTSSMGAGTDSFFEYIFKAYVLFGRQEYLDLFNVAFGNVQRMMQKPNLPYTFANVDMRSGNISNFWIDSLQAYVGSLLCSVGNVRGAVMHHLAYYHIWKRYGAMPERYNWQLKQPEVSVFPLRPEFVETTFALYRATRDPFYIEIGRVIMCDLQQHTLAACGYATLHDVVTKEQEDRMESFFLSETLKYLYLLFDDANVLHSKGWDHILTTQAHVIPLSPLYREGNGTTISVADGEWELAQMAPPAPSSTSAAVAAGAGAGAGADADAGTNKTRADAVTRRAGATKPKQTPVYRCLKGPHSVIKPGEIQQLLESVGKVYAPTPAPTTPAPTTPAPATAPPA